MWCKSLKVVIWEQQSRVFFFFFSTRIIVAFWSSLLKGIYFYAMHDVFLKLFSTDRRRIRLAWVTRGSEAKRRRVEYCIQTAMGMYTSVFSVDIDH